MAVRSLTIESRDGLALEAELAEEEGAFANLVLCHPHPQMGGTMNAPLLLALQEVLLDHGIAVLRFNFRGIGNSKGESSTGLAEVADAAGALDYMRTRDAERPLVIAGWSFGAAVAVRTTVATDGVAACVAIAPAVVPRPGITEGLPAPDEVPGSIPLLVVCASNDHLVAIEDGREWAQAAGARFVQVKAANHFFWAKYDVLSAAVADFLDEVL